MPIVRARLTACLALGLLLVGLASPVLVAAHAQLEATSPEAGTTVVGSPEVVSATFDDDLVPSKSSIEVLAPDGSTVATGGVSADDPKTLSTDVPTLAPGTYTVHWAAATEDGHLERDTYDFTVAEAPSAEPTAAPTPTAAAPTTPAGATMPPMSMATTTTPAATGPGTSAAPSPTASPTSDGSGGGSESMGQIVIIAVVGLALGLGIGWLRSRRGA